MGGMLRCGFARVAAMTVMLGAGVAISGAVAEDYRFMTGPQGGSWYPLGGAVSNLARGTVEDARLRVLPGGGISNVMAVEAGKADFSFGNVTSTVDALNGQAPFRGEAANIRHIATLYPQWFQFVASADSGVESVADMAGRAIAVGPRGHSGEQASRQILEVFGLAYDDLSKVNHVGYNDAVALLKDGHVDAFTVFTTVPAGAVMDSASARTIRLLPVPDDKLAALQSFNPQYVRRVIPTGTYPDMAEDLHTFGTWTHMIAHADVPDEVVYGVVRAMAENLGDLAVVVKSMGAATPESLATRVGVPMHPGAERYYREVGVLE